MLGLIRALFKSGQPAEKSRPGGISTSADLPRPFGFKTGWFALRTTDTDAAATAFGMTQPQLCNWTSGLAAVSGHRPSSKLPPIFVTPPLNGWTLAVTGSGINADTPEGCKAVAQTVTSLSKEFGEAQFFASHRVVEHSAWFIARKGQLKRAFSFVGDQSGLICNIGPATSPFEHTLHLDQLDGLSLNMANSILASLSDEAAEKKLPYLNETAPHKVARLWSLSPLDLPRSGDDIGVGILGRFTP
ncbi:hypothetical protein NBRC116590_18240 [Pelagimonas sp. KU-00592-HH]|uniref:hypothetical protein n=1 Tax=Pelagimonas sp. KU-00592-HH TaxID=3127651 RepID=UPI0031084519